MGESPLMHAEKGPANNFEKPGRKYVPQLVGP
jgi:hypothetical protein